MLQTARCSLEIIRDEACQLVQRGLLQRHQPIYMLCQFIAPREWKEVEGELARNDFLLRDRILDLIGCETWEDD